MGVAMAASASVAGKASMMAFPSLLLAAFRHVQTGL
jgi:hypothetical protein